MTESLTQPMTNSQHRIEDLAFENLIKQNTKERNWNLVQLYFLSYGFVLERRYAR